MIDELKLQAFLDGELPSAEAQAIAEQLAHDPDGAALLAELRQTGEALAVFEETVRLPETREFYWSKIQREILRQTPAPMGAPAPATPWFQGWLRLLAPASALCVLVLAGVLATRTQLHLAAGSPESESDMSDTGAMTYRDYEAKATLIWLSYPAEKEFARNDADVILP
jgi:anti-sigma factor RsiW